MTPGPFPVQPDPQAVGLLLLTGGGGRRFGAPKHGQPHPDGGSWGGRLVTVFSQVFPGGPIQLLGDPLPDQPGLIPLDDPRQGPAVALRHWAEGAEGGFPAPRRWWILACDQVRWTPRALASWHARVARGDPDASRWVLARFRGRLQPLGGFLPGRLVPSLARCQARSLIGLVEALPHRVLAARGEAWLDVDTPEGLRRWLG
jgi:molybdopterin-guanine dinucleotide biosynthesis protein A